MATEDDVVKISYSHLQSLVSLLPSGSLKTTMKADSPKSVKRNENKVGSQRMSKGKRPAQQIYRPGQLRQGQKGCVKGATEVGGEVDQGGFSEEDWDADIEVKGTPMKTQSYKDGRESSQELNEENIRQRLDDLHVDYPPRENSGTTVQHSFDEDDSGEQWGSSRGGMRDDSKALSRHRGGNNKRRGKRPDLQIYVPRARQGDKDRRSAEKDEQPGDTSSQWVVDDQDGDRHETGEQDNNCEEILVCDDTADSPRKVHVRPHEGIMKVTVMNESSMTSSSQSERSPIISRKQAGDVHEKNLKSQKQDVKDLPSDNHDRFKNREQEQYGKAQSRNDRPGKPVSSQARTTRRDGGRAKGTQGLGHSGIQSRAEMKKVDKPMKGFQRMRRSNSSDSRLKEDCGGDRSPEQGERGQFSSETFPRSKPSAGKSQRSAEKDYISASKNNKESLSNKTSGREGERFYWGMRRQRTGSISSEASVASNHSNGSFYSGSSDFSMEEDEPEHILNWGEEVEKAHLEELARLVHDGAQKLTSSLDAYPDVEEGDKQECANRGDAASFLNGQNATSVDKIILQKGKDGRTRRRNRQRKSSSRQASRDSSMHSGIHGEESNSERAHRRRRRRHSSRSSQGKQHQQHSHQMEDGRATESGGGDGAGQRSGLQVTIGSKNRLVEINRGTGRGKCGRERHKSDEHQHRRDDWSDHGYGVEAGHDWNNENDVENVEISKKDRYHQQWAKEPPPRFRRESGVEGRGRGCMRKSSGESHTGSGRQFSGSQDSNKHTFEDDWDKSEEYDRRACWDKRSIHPAHDASSSRTTSIGGRGRNNKQARDLIQENRNYPLIEQEHTGGRRYSSSNHDDHAISHKARGGLLQLPVKDHQPPRPHSNPSASNNNTLPHDSHHTGVGGGGGVGSNTRGPTLGKRQLFDPKNPSRPIMISEDAPAQLHFEDNDMVPSPGSSVSPDTQQLSCPSFPPAFYHPAYGFRPPMGPFPGPQGPFPMGAYPPGSIPPHMFFRFPRMAPPDMAAFYNSSDLDSEGMMSSGSRAQCRMMAEQILRDSSPFESQLGNILSRRTQSDDSYRMVNQIRAELQNRLEQVILLDVEVANKHNVEQTLWKAVYYQVIESHRKRMGDEAHDAVSKQRQMDVLDEGTRFFENLLQKLQATYEFDLEVFIDGARPVPENLGRNVKLALLSVQRVMMFLGDIARYREQSLDTTNFGKARHWYLKAQKIHPRNGRPYNQLAILAVYTRRKLDAVYYYMRSLAASNPILTARESLMSLFDEVRRKADVVEKKRVDDRKQRQGLRHKHQNRGPRVEIWISPDGTSSEDQHKDQDEEEDLTALSAIELNKRFVLTYLDVHGKLFTNINFEVFAEASGLMLQEFQTLIQHSPCVLSSMRLLQLMVINMFSIDNTVLKDESLDDSCRSLLQEHAVEIGLEMFGLLVQRSAELLSAQLATSEAQTKAKDSKTPSQASCGDGLGSHKSGMSSSLQSIDEPASHKPSPTGYPPDLDDDLHHMLPALKTWVDWMMCHAQLWNPQPFNRPPELGPQIDVWKNLAHFCDLLNSVETMHGCLIREQQPGYEPVILHEDLTLAGFVPMLSAPQEMFYAEAQLDKQRAEDWLRIEKLRLFGEYLCGVEPPMLAFNVELGKYYAMAPSPIRSEEKLVGDGDDLVDRHTSEESDDVITDHDNSSGDDDRSVGKEKDHIERLKAKKAELHRRKEESRKNKENMEAILDSHRHAKMELEIRPIFLVPDTNCFIDHFSMLKKILLTKKYTLIVPLVVINELDGLARGYRDQQSDSPEHMHMVKSRARAAVEYLEAEFEGKNSHLRAQTAKGSILETIAFRSEESSDRMGINDDIILSCCLHYCKDNARDFMPKDKDSPVRLYREVVLLTDDRNLRLKAHTCNVPVKDVPSFKAWSKIL